MVNHLICPEGYKVRSYLIVRTWIISRQKIIYLMKWKALKLKNKDLLLYTPPFVFLEHEWNGSNLSFTIVR